MTDSEKLDTEPTGNDDHFQGASEPTNSNAGINLIINGIFGYYCYIYAFRNPDAGECFASSDGFNNTASAVQTPQADIDVSAKFSEWFLYGFFLNTLAVFYSIFGFCY